MAQGFTQQLTIPVPTSKGGTGLVSPGTAGNVLTSTGSVWSSAAPNTGIVVQQVRTQTGAVAQGTTTIPQDNTIPQNTEGTQFMSLAITPTNTNSKLEIKVTIAMLSHSLANANMISALFQDSTANALSTMFTAEPAAQITGGITFTYVMTAGTTSSTTFKVRIGSSTAGTTTFNGDAAGNPYMGGTLASTIIITEYTS